MIRPRKFHGYNLGAGRTGTTWITKVFSNYRAAHEARALETIELIENRWKSEVSESAVCRQVRARDRKGRLEFESTNFLVYLCDHLVQTFPSAKFVCTVRPPRSWLRSNIDQCLNNPRDRLAESADHYRRLRDLNYGAPPDEYPSEEAALAEHNLHSLSGFLRYWSWHYQRVLDEVPEDRLLILKTEELDTSLPEIARFFDVSRKSLSRPNRANTSSERHGIFDTIDESYISKKISKICASTIDKINKANNQKFNE
jgi:hypothetical protein